MKSNNQSDAGAWAPANNTARIWGVGAAGANWSWTGAAPWMTWTGTTFQFMIEVPGRLRAGHLAHAQVPVGPNLWVWVSVDADTNGVEVRPLVGDGAATIDANELADACSDWASFAGWLVDCYATFAPARLHPAVAAAVAEGDGFVDLHDAPALWDAVREHWAPEAVEWAARVLADAWQDQAVKEAP